MDPHHSESDGGSCRVLMTGGVKRHGPSAAGVAQACLLALSAFTNPSLAELRKLRGEPPASRPLRTGVAPQQQSRERLAALLPLDISKCL